MNILNNEEVTAVKRAAMISAALTWLFAQIPIAVFPPPLQPVVLLLQKIVPYISYIGTFISWSWEAVKEYDTGKGTPDWILCLLPVISPTPVWLFFFIHRIRCYSERNLVVTRCADS